VFIFALGKEADTILNLKDCPGLFDTTCGQFAETSNLFGLVPPLKEFLKFISEFVIIVLD
jgi:hypothetical protein